MWLFVTMYDLYGGTAGSSRSEVLPPPYLPLKDLAITPGHTALQRCLDGTGKGAASGTVPGRAVVGSAKR